MVNSSTGQLPSVEIDPWASIRALILAAKGDGRTLESKSWTQLAEQASFIPGVPQVDGEALRTALNRGCGSGAFSYGHQIRAVAAVLDIPLVEILTAGRWWPDLRWSSGISPRDRVSEGLRMMGLEVQSSQMMGKQVVVYLR